MDLATFLIQCLNALQYGLLLFLVASGLTLIFGIMGVINLAHGSFYMIGAYLAFSLSSLLGSLPLALLGDWGHWFKIADPVLRSQTPAVRSPAVSAALNVFVVDSPRITCSFDPVPPES